MSNPDEVDQPSTPKKASIRLTNGQMSMKLSDKEQALVNQALDRISPAGKLLLVTNDEGETYTHRSVLTAILHDFLNPETNAGTLDSEEFSRLQSDLLSLQEKYDTDVKDLTLKLEVKDQEILQLQNQMNVLAVDADKYYPLNLQEPHLKDFFDSFQRRKTAGVSKTIEGFIFQLYKRTIESLHPTKQVENHLIWTPGNYKK